MMMRISESNAIYPMSNLFNLKRAEARCVFSPLNGILQLDLKKLSRDHQLFFILIRKQVWPLLRKKVCGI